MQTASLRASDSIFSDQERKILQNAKAQHADNSRLVELPERGTLIVVGDTHGDLSASEKILKQYLNPLHTIVFLGDYVDRGPSSKENLLFLLQMKNTYPDQIHLLQGNHEGWPAMPFSPSDFWEALSEVDIQLCKHALSGLPIAATSGNGLLLIHGGLPEVSRIEDIRSIPVGSDFWRHSVWGDFQERQGYFLGDIGGRTQLGSTWFTQAMEQLDKTVLIRGHQLHCPMVMFDRRCLTIMTTSRNPPRRIAIVNLSQPVRTTDDLRVEEI